MSRILPAQVIIRTTTSRRHRPSQELPCLRPINTMLVPFLECRTLCRTACGLWSSTGRLLAPPPRAVPSHEGAGGGRQSSTRSAACPCRHQRSCSTCHHREEWLRCIFPSRAPVISISHSETLHYREVTLRSEDCNIFITGRRACQYDAALPLTPRGLS